MTNSHAIGMNITILCKHCNSPVWYRFGCWMHGVFGVLFLRNFVVVAIGQRLNAHHFPLVAHMHAQARQHYSMRMTAVAISVVHFHLKPLPIYFDQLYGHTMIECSCPAIQLNFAFHIVQSATNETAIYANVFSSVFSFLTRQFR